MVISFAYHYSLACLQYLYCLYYDIVCLVSEQLHYARMHVTVDT